MGVAQNTILALERAAVHSQRELQGRLDAVHRDARAMNQDRVVRHAHYAHTVINKSNDIYDCLSHEAEEDRARGSIEVEGLARKVDLCNIERDSQVVVIARLTAQLNIFHVLLRVTQPENGGTITTSHHYYKQKH